MNRSARPSCTLGLIPKESDDIPVLKRDTDRMHQDILGRQAEGTCCTSTSVFWPARPSGISSRNWRITLGIYAHVFPGMHKEVMKEMDDWFRNDEKINPTEKGK